MFESCLNMVVNSAICVWLSVCDVSRISRICRTTEVPHCHIYLPVCL